jgi:hypothetical protein
MQLRACNVALLNDICCFRFTPDAGMTKSGEERDVPIHQQLIDQGFLDFARAHFGRPDLRPPAPALLPYIKKLPRYDIPGSFPASRKKAMRVAAEYASAQIRRAQSRGKKLAKSSLYRSLVPCFALPDDQRPPT